MPPASAISMVPVFSLAAASSPRVTLTPSTPTIPSVIPPADWMTLLAQQLPAAAHQPPKSPPLILSPALPPIPGKVVEKILRGENPDLKEMLSDNLALAKRIRESHPSFPSFGTMSRFREVSDPITWVYCFLNFIAVKVDDAHTRSLIAYVQIVLDMARRHGGSGWLAYDTHFRSQLFAGGTYGWNEVNPSLLASAVLGNSRVGEGEKTCTRCMASDHSTTECAMAPLQEKKHSPTIPPPPSANRQSAARQASAPYPPPTRPEEPCRRYNKGLCSSKACRYDHSCNSCYRGAHPAIECRGRTKRGTDETSNPKSQ